MAPGQTINIGNIDAKTAGALNVDAERERVPDDPDTDPADESDPTRWGTTILVTYTATAGDVPDGYNDAAYTYQTSIDDGENWVDADGTQVNDADDDPIPGRFTIPTPGADAGGDGEFMVRVVATAADDGTNTPALDPLVINSDPATVTAVDPSASGVTAVRGVTDADPPVDTLGVSWSAVTNGQSTFRVVIELAHSGVGQTVWLVAPTDGTVGSAIAADGTTRTWRLAIPAADAAAAAGWTYVAGGGAAPDVSRADLLKALTVAVESVQGAVSDDNPWKRSAAVSVGAKPDDG